MGASGSLIFFFLELFPIFLSTPFGFFLALGFFLGFFFGFFFGFFLAFGFFFGFFFALGFRFGVIAGCIGCIESGGGIPP